MKRIKAACLCQTLHFQQKEDVPYEEAVRLTDGEWSITKKRWSAAGPSTAFWNKAARQTGLLF